MGTVLLAQQVCDGAERPRDGEAVDLNHVLGVDQRLTAVDTRQASATLTVRHDPTGNESVPVAGPVSIDAPYPGSCLVADDRVGWNDEFGCRYSRRSCVVRSQIAIHTIEDTNDFTVGHGPAEL